MKPKPFTVLNHLTVPFWGASAMYSLETANEPAGRAFGAKAEADAMIKHSTRAQTDLREKDDMMVDRFDYG